MDKDLYNPFRVKLFGLKQNIRFLKDDEVIQEGDRHQIADQYLYSAFMNEPTAQQLQDARLKAMQDIKQARRGAAGNEVSGSIGETPADYPYRIFIRQV